MTPDPKELRALLAKATPGEWRVEQDTNLIWGDCNPEDRSTRGMGYPVAEVRMSAPHWGRDMFGLAEKWEANAAFIAASRTAVPALLDENEALRSEKAALLDRVEELEAGLRAVVAWADEFRLPARHDLRLIAKPLLTPSDRSAT